MMPRPRAHVLLRKELHYRLDAFCAGFEALGFDVSTDMPYRGRPGDVLCIWNRYRGFDEPAAVFESQGGTVIVAENGYLGKTWRGGAWYALAHSYHNTAGRHAVIEGRWASFGVELAPWHAVAHPSRLLLLPQRGIGSPGVAMPLGWTERTSRALAYCGYDVRVRRHPGNTGEQHGSLLHDIEASDAVVTWGSGAAVKALLHGKPVLHDYARWIARDASTPLRRFLTTRSLDVADRRVPMFRQLAGAIWQLNEIHTGVGLKEVLTCAKYPQ